MLKDLIRAFSRAMCLYLRGTLISYFPWASLPWSTVHSTQHTSSPPGYTLIGFIGSWASSCFPCIKTSCPLCLLSCIDHSQNVISCETEICQIHSEGIHLLLQIHTMCMKALELWFTICYWHFCCKLVKGGHLTQCMFYRRKMPHMEWLRDTEDKM